MINDILNLSGNANEASVLVLAVILFGMTQYLLNKRQTNELSGNHMAHILEALRAHQEREERYLADITVLLRGIDDKINTANDRLSFIKAKIGL